jgi:hypothetical protein
MIRVGSALVLLAGLAGAAASSDAWAGEPAVQPASAELRGGRIALKAAYGQRVVSASVVLDGSTGDRGADVALQRRVEQLADTVRDAPLQGFVVDRLQQQVQQLPNVKSARLSAFDSSPPGQVVLEIEVVPAGTQDARAPERTGLFATGAAASLPLLHQDGDSQFKLILNGGVGTYATSNPLFGHGDLFTRGNIAARDPAGPGTTSWVESYIEPGIGGITRLGDSPVYAFGSATYLLSASWGQDLYDSGSRDHGAWEQAYGGLIVDLPGKDNRLKVSSGRQIYQLRQGFLISKIPGSTNLGQLGAVWLGPRLAFDRTFVAELKNGRFTAEGIVLEPTEHPGLETGTRIAGATVGYNDGQGVDVALSYLAVPRSTKPYFAPDGSTLGTRDGLRTISPSLWFNRVFGVDGLWFKAEAAWQTHESIDMKAHAFALWPGYRASHLPWKPGISYRLSQFSGDKPGTARFERYDPLLAGGQNNYVTGMLLSGAIVNSNLRSQRLTLTAHPSEQLALTLEYTVHRALELNNRGGIGPLQVLGSKDLAQEIDLFASVYLGRNFYIQGLLAAARPGAAIEQAVGGNARNWYAAQLSVYFFY